MCNYFLFRILIGFYFFICLGVTISYYNICWATRYLGFAAASREQVARVLQGVWPNPLAYHGIFKCHKFPGLNMDAENYWVIQRTDVGDTAFRASRGRPSKNCEDFVTRTVNLEGFAAWMCTVFLWCQAEMSRSDKTCGPHWSGVMAHGYRMVGLVHCDPLRY